MSKSDFQTGTVKFFNSAKGWGFVTPDSGKKDLFVHFFAIEEEGFRTLNEGDRCEFTVGEGRKGPEVKQLRRLD